MNKDHVQHLLKTTLGAAHVDPLLERIAIDRAGGNPLFILELAQALKKSGLISMERQRAILKSPVTQLNLPTGVYEILAARLDALPEQNKQIAQIAAVVGMRFSVTILKNVLENPTDLDHRIAQLEKTGIIEHMPNNNGTVYRFRQQLMRDVAYEMMLQRTRRELHLKIGETMETLYRDRMTDVIGQLAYHFYEADVWSKALAYNLEAGHRARLIFACWTALTCFDRAVTILDRHRPDDHGVIKFEVLRWKGLMHYCCGQLQASRDSFQSMLAEARKIQNSKMISESLFRVGWISFFLHKPQTALKNLSAARDRAIKEGQTQLQLKAGSFLGYLQLVLGRYDNAREPLIEVLDRSEETTDLESRVWALSALIKHYNWSGEFNEALRLCNELDSLNRQLNSRFFENFLIFHLGLIHTALGQWKKARTILESGIRSLEQRKDTFWLPRLRNTLGWMLALEKKPQQALAMNEQSLSEAMEEGDLETIYNARINLVENRLQLGDVLKAKEEILEIWNQIRYRRDFYAIWRVKSRARLSLAYLSLVRENRREALRHVSAAYQIAEKTGSGKHRALALKLRAKIVRPSQPKRALKLLEQALHLAVRMEIPWLVKTIHSDKKALPQGLRRSASSMGRTV